MTRGDLEDVSEKLRVAWLPIDFPAETPKVDDITVQDEFLTTHMLQEAVQLIDLCIASS